MGPKCAKSGSGSSSYKFLGDAETSAERSAQALIHYNSFFKRDFRRLNCGNAVAIELAGIAAHSLRFKITKMIGALHQIVHVGGRMYR